MASKFTAGMTNFVQVLNEMWDKFAAGPFNALPLTGGTLTGPVVSGARITADSLAATTFISAGPIGTGVSSSIRAANSGTPGVAGTFYEVGSYGVASVGTSVWAGRMYWSTCGGFGSAYSAGYRMVLRAFDVSTQPQYGTDLLMIQGDGRVSVPGFVTVGAVSSTFLNVGYNTIYRDVVPTEVLLRMGRTQEPGSRTLVVWAAVDDKLWSPTPCVLWIGAQANGRSISAAGTFNASGADYAEYMVKSSACATVAPGQIIGIDANGQITDHWGQAVAFAVKSTDPCMVGGDRWGQHLGERPEAVTRILATTRPVLVSEATAEREAEYRDELVPGETDAEWAARQAPGLAFDAALEAARQTVDRIAFAGQVPVNVQGATPGQYIVPVQAGEGIAGVAIDEDDMTFKQYLRTLGKVIAIEEDGRARIIVKVA